MSRGVFRNLRRPDENALGNANVAEIDGGANVLVHAAAEESYFAPVFRRKLDGQLDAVGARGEASDEDPEGVRLIISSKA